MYDRAATFWQMIILMITSLQDMGMYRGRRNRARILNAQLWGAHMRFFRQMLMASKVSRFLADHLERTPVCTQPVGVAISHACSRAVPALPGTMWLKCTHREPFGVCQMRYVNGSNA